MKDWRLQGQQKYLQGVKLQFSVYHNKSTKWDHDHCEFCSSKFSNNPADQNEGYCTLDKSRWICLVCKDDFQHMFQWTVQE